MYLYGYNIHMKTTINIKDDLLKEAMKISGAKTKTEAVEIGLKEIISSNNRKRLANLFGSEKNVTLPRRRRI